MFFFFLWRSVEWSDPDGSPDGAQGRHVPDLARLEGHQVPRRPQSPLSPPHCSVSLSQLCPALHGTVGAARRDFWKKQYSAIKSANSSLPILLRESQGIQAKLTAAYRAHTRQTRTEHPPAQLR